MLRWLLQSLLLSVVSLAVFVLFCEFVVFRFIFPASDIPRNTYSNDILKYEPNQTGVYRIRNEIAARYTINAQGWNSGHSDYADLVEASGRREVDGSWSEPGSDVSAGRNDRGRPRVAIVGDSFVEAFQVDSDRSFAELLEGCVDADVFRFGLSGSPLSQYLHVVRNELDRYEPQVVIILLTHNDFIESYRYKIGRYTYAFARFHLVPDAVFEVSPQPYEDPRLLWIRGTAWYRFMVDRMRVSVEGMKEWLLRHDASQEYAANVRRASIREEWDNIKVVTRYSFEQLRTVGGHVGFTPVILIDGDRNAIYSGEPSEAYELNRLCVEMGREFGVTVIDLHPVFVDRYAEDERKFEFENDAHWNEYAHEVVAAALCAIVDSLTVASP